jgi:hypothetical protein
MGASSRGYLTTDTLLSTIKREAAVPATQSFLTDDDLLDMANQEIRVAMMPTIMQFHQEYLVHSDAPQTLIANQSGYAIPYRAVGGKVRDVFYLDQSNNLCKLTRIDPDNKPYFQQSGIQNSYYSYFVENDNVVLMPVVGSNPSGSLAFSYYMRPNELVDESRVATITAISTPTSLSGSITSISIASPTVITSAAHGLSTGNIINISNSNSTPSVDGLYTVTVVNANTFTIPVNVNVAGTTGSWEYDVTTFTVDDLPTVTAFYQNGQSVTSFTTSTLVDILQRKPGHKTLSYDVSPIAVDSVNKTITFYTPDIETYVVAPNVIAAPVTGDYIAFAGESIIPQIPSDLHDILSQRVVLRVLQSLGDAQGYQIAKDKLDDMNKLMGNLIDNRTEGNQKKINNLGSVLRAAKSWNRTGFY